jgi:hypothetical protein
MSIAKKSMTALAAALMTSVFSATSFAGVFPAGPVPVEKAQLPPPPPPPVQICLPVILVGTVCFNT